jgi:hypothetical protein
MKNSVKILRERFITKFCKKKGWSPNKLTPEQVKAIVTDPMYINPVF